MNFGGEDILLELPLSYNNQDEHNCRSSTLLSCWKFLYSPREFQYYSNIVVLDI